MLCCFTQSLLVPQIWGTGRENLFKSNLCSLICDPDQRTILAKKLMNSFKGMSIRPKKVLMGTGFHNNSSIVSKGQKYVWGRHPIALIKHTSNASKSFAVFFKRDVQSMWICVIRLRKQNTAFSLSLQKRRGTSPAHWMKWNHVAIIAERGGKTLDFTNVFGALRISSHFLKQKRCIFPCNKQTFPACQITYLGSINSWRQVAE